MSQTMNSQHFTCALLEKDPDLGEPVTILILRRIHFPHTPVILTASEIQELRALLQRWPEQGSSRPKEAKQEEA